MAAAPLQGHQLVAWVDTPGPDAHVRIRRDIEIPRPTQGEALIKSEYAGVCQSDVACILGRSNMITNIGGHEGHLTKIPEQLSPSTVAPRLYAGLTMYSAIAKAGLKTGDWLVLPGAGGGLGHLGLQIAAKQGYRTIAIDTGPEKRRLCMELGASAFFDYTVDDVEASVKALTSGYGAHAAICTASSFGAYKQSLEMLRNLGTLVCIGLAVDNLPISPLDMIVRGVRVIGSSVGTEGEMQDLLSMAVSGQVKPSVKSFDFEDIDMVLQKLAKFQITGRAVIHIPP
ncbi:hypothetical protein LTR49_025571 [Elasticomyces elasticus]|nr:hypothetical protein LTR49_025571 [Elasticomyces elasticus]